MDQRLTPTGHCSLIMGFVAEHGAADAPIATNMTKLTRRRFIVNSLPLYSD
jgi:hypothetical protein